MIFCTKPLTCYQASSIRRRITGKVHPRYQSNWLRNLVLNSGEGSLSISRPCLIQPTVFLLERTPTSPAPLTRPRALAPALAAPSLLRETRSTQSWTSPRVSSQSLTTCFSPLSTKHFKSLPMRGKTRKTMTPTRINLILRRHSGRQWRLETSTSLLREATFVPLLAEAPRQSRS